MKRILRSFLIEIGVLYLISQSVAGMNFQNGVTSLVITGAALAVAVFLVKPIINVLLLPINLVTFGIFKWLSQSLTLYIVDLALSEFTITHFSFTGINTEWFFIPSFTAPNLVVSYIAFSLIISLISGVINWLVK